MVNGLKRAIVFGSILLLSACANIAPLTTTGMLLKETDNAFLQVGADFNRMCAPNALPALRAEDCAAFKGFVPTFQGQAALAKDTWDAISACQIAEAQVPTGKDCGSTLETINVITSLKNILGQYILMVLTMTQAGDTGIQSVDAFSNYPDIVYGD